MKPSSVLILAALLLGTAAAADSLPRFALMTGAKCGSCHVNATGAGMRNDYGISFSQEKLPIEALKDSDFAFSHKLNDNISIGADYRGQFIYDFSTAPDFTTSPKGQSASGQSTFHAMQTSLYGAVQLGKKFTFQFKQDLLHAPYASLGGPEAFLTARILPGNWYIKGGEFLPDYGWRLDDHTSYIRGGDLAFLPGLPNNVGMIWLPNYKDVGIEVGGPAGSLTLTGGLFNGTGNTQTLAFSTQKAYTGKVEQAGSIAALNYRIGVSGYGYKSFKMGGINVGVGTEDVVVLAEADWTHQRIDVTAFNVPVTEGVNEMAAYAELDVRAMQGLWLTGKFDMFDPQQGVADDENSPFTNSLKRVTFGAEIFPWSFIEIRPQYRLNIETPSVTNDQILVQTHVWY